MVAQLVGVCPSANGSGSFVARAFLDGLLTSFQLITMFFGMLVAIVQDDPIANLTTCV